MGSIARVFHHSAKPVSLLEFTDALHATCPRLHPRARHSRHRTIGLATSGGVDSMALAYLFSLLRTQTPGLLIGDNPCSDVAAMVIDHKLRPNSAQEARAVVAELEKMRHISPRVLELNWGDVDPLTLTNLETAARRLRYRRLGETCAWENIDNLFLGHHADDMHETVLMRLLGGHPARGLAGMRRSNDIPECYDMHGAYQSGFVDQMAGKKPPLTYSLRRKEAYGLRRDLLSDMRPQLRIPTDDERMSYLDVKPRPSPEDHEDYAYEEGYDDLIEEGGEEKRRSREKPELDQLDTEDGGVRICRPLLDFEKDRLIATCEQNGITWFEDPTNADPGLTTRNAVRHMVRNHKLPEALRRPAILRLAERVRESVQGEEEEARRLLLERTNLLDFRTNAGTLEAEFPDLHPGEDPERARTVAALLVRRVIEVVSPETHSPALPSLQGTVSRLFPRLATPAHPTSQPTSFNIAGVLLSRLPDSGTSSSSGAAARWLLSRAPYPAPNPLPEVHYFQRKGFPHHGSGVVRMRPRWTHVNKKWRLFDGRFWVLLRLRMPGHFTVAPFRPEHSKAFKAALGREERERLEALLVGHAPGKVRYTLPAVYYDGVVDLEGDGGGTVPGRGGLGMMVALPSLGVHLPGLEKLMTYEVRYKKVDREILEKCHLSVL